MSGHDEYYSKMLLAEFAELDADREFREMFRRIFDNSCTIKEKPVVLGVDLARENSDKTEVALIRGREATCVILDESDTLKSLITNESVNVRKKIDDELKSFCDRLNEQIAMEYSVPKENLILKLQKLKTASLYGSNERRFTVLERLIPAEQSPQTVDHRDRQMPKHYGPPRRKRW